MALLVGITSASSAQVGAAGAGPDWKAPRVAGQLLVKLSDAAAADAEEVPARWEDVHLLRTIPQLGLAVVETSRRDLLMEPKDLEVVAAGLEARADVAWVEPNYLLEPNLEPDDPHYNSRQAAYLARISLPAAWDLTTGRPEIIIAVLDTGIDLDHPDLSAGIWSNADEIPANGLDDDANGFVDDVHGWDFAGNDNLPDDDHGHGTHVAGIAAARIGNGVGIAGVAGAATIMPVDVFAGGIGTYEDLIRAILYATDNGARVINMSLGASSYSRGEAAAVDYAWEHDVVVVAAAGNAGRETYHYPAAHTNAIAVASTTADDTLSSFSSRGDFVDVAAPGSSVYSTYRGGSYGYMSGTSMATPHVAGLAALILARNPSLSAPEVRQLIEGTVDDLGPVGRDISFGWGRINAYRALMQTTPGTELPPLPTWPPLVEWPAGCINVLPDGDFETGAGAWQLSGDVVVDNTRAYMGSRALHFQGGPGAAALVTRTVTLPSNSSAASLWFAYRIENTDSGWGPSPEFPYDDWMVVALARDDGQHATTLLRTGNSADTAGDGLPWDRYLFRMRLEDLSPFQLSPGVNLVFQVKNDEDALPTSFWLDEVRFCVDGWSRWFYPMTMQSSQ